MIESLYSLFKQSTGISTDTRRIKKGSLFFALKGENFNGNSFATEALKKGAMGAVIDESAYDGDRMFLVDDVLSTLQNLAKAHREQFDIPIIAITGSNGKTTTKELITNVLTQKYKVHYTLGNLNNHIGVPLTLLEMPMDTEVAVIEMGANHQGEIKLLSEITKPNLGLITNIGKAHLEGFGGLEGVRKGKLELYDNISNTDGHFFVNSNDQILAKSIVKNRIDYSVPECLKYQDSIEFMYRDFKVHSALFGNYNMENIAAAISIGEYLGISTLDIIYGIESYVPHNNRSQIIHIGSNTVILDAYNANPTSMKLSLSNFQTMEGYKIAILGAMKELGTYSDKEHEDLYRFATNSGIEEVYFYGNEFNPHSISFDKIKALINLKDRQNCLILLKGSRATHLERIIY